VKVETEAAVRVNGEPVTGWRFEQSYLDDSHCVAVGLQQVWQTAVAMAIGCQGHGAIAKWLRQWGCSKAYARAGYLTSNSTPRFVLYKNGWMKMPSGEDRWSPFGMNFLSLGVKRDVPYFHPQVRDCTPGPAVTFAVLHAGALLDGAAALRPIDIGLARAVLQKPVSPAGM
jgi:hypothetical protein